MDLCVIRAGQDGWVGSDWIKLMYFDRSRMSRASHLVYTVHSFNGIEASNIDGISLIFYH